MLFRLKRQLLWPWVAVQKHIHRNTDSYTFRVMEVFAFSPGIKRFLEADKDGEMLQTHPDLSGDSVVLDIGGYVGEWARAVYDRYNCRIHIFEPLPGLARKLEELFSDTDKVTVHHFGLMDRNTEMEVYMRGPGSTVYVDSPDGDGSAPLKRRHVPMRDAREVIEGLGHDEFDLVKINIEGGEYTVLPQMIEAGLHRRCRQIMIQYHEWIPGAYLQRWKITRALKKTHRRVWNYPFIWEKWERK